MFQIRVVRLEGHVFKMQSLEVIWILPLRHTLAKGGAAELEAVLDLWL